MVNRERAPKRKLAFFLERSEAIIIFGFQAQLEGNIAASNESRQK